MILAVLVVSTGALLIYALASHDEAGIAAAWDELRRRGRGGDAVASLRARFAGDRLLVDVALQGAREAADAGEPAHAARMLQAGCRCIEDCAPERVRVLDGLVTYSRMVRAIGPGAPLAPWRLRLGAGRAAAAAGALVHGVLPTPGQRFRFRLRVLRWSAAAALGAARGARLRLACRPASDVLPLAQAARADLAAVEDEAIASLELLLAALSLEDDAAATTTDLPR